MSKIIIVTGPAGAGKSTACKMFAETSAGTWAYIGQDDVRQMVKNGFKNPATRWDKNTEIQWDVSHHISTDIMKRYQASGINCIIDGFAPRPMASFENWPEYLESINYELIVIYPSLETALERNRKRTGAAKLDDTLIERHHEWYGKFIEQSGAKVIDSSQLSAVEVVEKFKNIIESADS